MQPNINQIKDLEERLSAINTKITAIESVNSINATNTSGSSGTAGTSGLSGTSGVSGTSGTSGTSVAVSGTTNTITKFTSASTIGNSNITDNGSSITMGVQTTFSSNIFMTNTNYAFGINYWAGAGGYPGYQFTGGNSRFGFSSTSGYIDVYTDGNFYAGIDLNGLNNLVLHTGNYNSYAPTLTGGNASGTWGISITGRGYPRRSDGSDMNFYWSGQSGQPPWLWGGNDGTNMYVYNPSNFCILIS